MVMVLVMYDGVKEARTDVKLCVCERPGRITSRTTQCVINPRIKHIDKPRNGRAQMQQSMYGKRLAETSGRALLHGEVYSLHWYYLQGPILYPFDFLCLFSMNDCIALLIVRSRVPNASIPECRPCSSGGNCGIALRCPPFGPGSLSRS